MYIKIPQQSHNFYFCQDLLEFTEELALIFGLFLHMKEILVENFQTLVYYFYSGKRFNYKRHNGPLGDYLAKVWGLLLECLIVSEEVAQILIW